MSNNISGINEDEIDKLILKISDNSSRIRKLFNEIFDIAEDSIVYSNFKPMNSWRNNIKLLKDDCNIVINDLLTSKSNLQNIKMLYNDKMVELSKRIKSKAIVKIAEREQEHLKF